MKQESRVIGLMSGTSVDGVDICYCNFWQDRKGGWKYKFLQGEVIPYSEDMHSKLKNATDLGAEDLLLLNNEYGKWLGMRLDEFIRKNQIGGQVDLISSHGHTVFHQIDKMFTYQIGSGRHISNVTGVRVVSDFRTMDVSLGGHGAPCASIGDELLWPHFDVCINLGGIANFSYKLDGLRRSFDVCPVNMLFNHLTQLEGISFDENGLIAASGTLREDLLEKLNGLEYYGLEPPKSLGYEWFCEEVVPILNLFEYPLKDKLHTCVFHAVHQISRSVRSSLDKTPQPYTLLVTGGGARNKHLMKSLSESLDCCQFSENEQEILIDFKEAIFFGLMGVLRVQGKPNFLSSVTGASADSVGGLIFEPQ